MKIKVIEKSYDEVMRLKSRRKRHRRPIKPNIFFRTLMKVVAAPDLKNANFKSEKIGMERLGDEPALFLMNHSSFIDLEIVADLLFPRPFNIVTTSDGFIGKDWLMRHIGCIPTNKFVTDTTLVRDIMYAIKKKRSSIVLFPEAGYSFDGTSTTLPETTAQLIKHLGIPVVMIHSYGAFSRDPLYNNLHKRAVDVNATETYILSPEDIERLSVEEIDDIVHREFSFDSFEWQFEHNIKIDDPTRAEGLNRVLYKCPHCLAEGKTVGDGTTLTCSSCGATYELNEYGHLDYKGEGEGKFTHIPDWYLWEREMVREEILRDEYAVDVPVDICMTVDTTKLFRIGTGRLTHGKDGFVLEGDGSSFRYEQKPMASYTVNSDFNWYELGDIISIGNNEHLFYCFPRIEGDIVAKIRLASEELYKIVKAKANAEREARRAEREAERAKSAAEANHNTQA